MAEQERNEEGHASEEDVSMDEILTSLRSILEEEDTGQSSQPSENQSAEEPEPAAAPSQPPETAGPSWSLDEEADGPASGDDEELVLTDVVDEGSASAEPASVEEPPGLSGTQAGAGEEPPAEDDELESLIGSLEEEAASSSGPEPEPQPTAFGGEDEGAEVLEFGEPASAEPEPAAEPGPALESATTGIPDSDAIRQTVEATVSERVAQATADLDSRLAEALEPKLREALEGYLSERLPALLREMAEAEIERIKRGE